MPKNKLGFCYCCLANWSDSRYCPECSDPNNDCFGECEIPEGMTPETYEQRYHLIEEESNA